MTLSYIYDILTDMETQEARPLSIHMDAALHERIERAAEKLRRKKTALARLYIEEGLERDEKQLQQKG